MKTILAILLFGVSAALATGQTTDANKPDPARVGAQRMRDFAFANGVDLQFLIKTLGRDLDLNVLFDVDSRLENRKTKIELRNVTTAAALDYVLLQEGLYFEPAGPKTILVANQIRGLWVPSLNIRVQGIDGQLGEYFGVTRGLLIIFVPENSPANKAGLKAGDVIVGVDGAAVGGTLGLIRAIDDKPGKEFSLAIVRDHDSRSINVSPQKGIGTVLQSN